MSPTPTITQVDRDAAIGLAEALDLPVTLAWLKKQADKPHLFSEAFAKHRESAVAELQVEVDKHCLAIANEIKNPNGRTPLQIISVIVFHNARARAALAQKEPVE